MRVFSWKMAATMGLGSLYLSSLMVWGQAEPGDSPFDHQPETRLACDRLKAQIDRTIRDNGARHFLLEIVDNAQVEDGVVKAGESYAGAEVVGSCDGGTRKVVYSREGATEMSAPEAENGANASTPDAASGSDGSLPESSGDAVPAEPDNGETAREPESSP